MHMHRYWTSPAAWAALQNTVTAAQSVYSNPAVTQTQIDDEAAVVGGITLAFERERRHGTLSIGYASPDILNAALSDAQALLDLTVVSVNGSDVAAGEFWTTQAARTIFANTIAAATSIRNNTASTQAQINSAAAALRDAISTFELARRPGALPIGHVSRAGLSAAIAEAQAMFTNTFESANGTDVFNNRHWTTTAVRTVFQNAIAAAQSVYSNTASTQAQVNSAAATLRDAILAFTHERRLGTLPPPQIPVVRVGGGVFYLGREEGTASAWGNTTPISRVTMSGFYIGRYPVTQGQWYAVMGTWPNFFTGTNNSSGTTVTPTLNRNNLPVERVSWYDAIVFSNRLSILRGLTPAYSIGGSTNPDDWGSIPTTFNATWNVVTIVPGSIGYRLPTEAQWEFAAKDGPLDSGFTFSGSNIVSDVAWHSGNSGSRTREVGGLQANRLGIHDMSGNVLEWVWDWSGSYTSVDKTDPLGASSGSVRVLRGGGWISSDHGVRSVSRGGYDPARRYVAHFGFRVAHP